MSRCPLSSIAFSGTGHISSQTMQGVSGAQGRQRSLSITATPMTWPRFSGSESGGIAPEGQTCPQAWHA